MEHPSSQPRPSAVSWLPTVSSPGSRSQDGPGVQRFVSIPVSTSTTISTTPPIPISQLLQQAILPAPSISPHELHDLQADVKKVLEHVAASREEQKNLSLSVGDLITRVEVLECVLCGNVGRSSKNTDPATIHGGIAHQLVDMEAAIDDLAARVKADRRSPVVYRDANIGHFPNSRRASLLAFSTNEPDHILSLATPSPDSPGGKSFRRADDKVTNSFNSFPGSQPGLGSIDQDSLIGSPSRTLNSSSSVEVTLTPVCSSTPSKFNSDSSLKPKAIQSHPIPSSSKTATSDDIIPVPSMQQSSQSTHTAIVHSMSPTRTPNLALSRARAASLSRTLLGLQPTMTEDVDCEGLCEDCEAECRGQQGSQDQTMGLLEYQNQNSGSQGQTSLDTLVGDLHSPPRSVQGGANAKASPPVLGMALSVDVIAPLAQPVPRASSNDFLYVAAREHEDLEPCAPGPISTREDADANGDLDDVDFDEGMQLDDVSNARGLGKAEPGNLRGFGLEDVLECVAGEDLQVDAESDGADPDGSRDESVKSVKDCSVTALAPDTCNLSRQSLHGHQGCQNEYPEEFLTDPEGNVQPENVLPEKWKPSSSGLSPSDTDHLHEYELPQAEYSREPTPADSLLQDEEAVAAALAAESYSSEDVPTPLPFPHHLSPLSPPRPGPEKQNEHVSPGTQDHVHDSPETRMKFHHHHHHHHGHHFVVSDSLNDSMGTYADGETSALRSTCTETHADLQVQELTATPEHIEVSAQFDHTEPPHTIAITTLPYLPSLSSPRVSSLSPLSSLAESLPQLENDANSGDERQNGKGAELRRAESLHSNEEVEATLGLSGLALQKSTMLGSTGLRKSSASLAPRGGPDASIEELSVLARRNPPRLNINLSDLKRKLESSGSLVEQAGKRAKFDKDEGKPVRRLSRSSKSMQDVTSFRAEVPMLIDSASSSGIASEPASMVQMKRTAANTRRLSRPSRVMQDVNSFGTESISTPMLMNGTSGSGTISGPATVAKMKRMEAPVQAGSTRDSKKRARLPSQKVKESMAQKVRQPRRNASDKSPRKRKSKSLPFEDEGPTCQWPAKSDSDKSFQRQFVQCDNCDLWYHFGCVGIVEGDSRLKEEAAFICPPCCVSTAKRVTLRNRGEICARSDCFYAHLDAPEYVIERLVGRKRVGKAGFLYLVKWEGYPITQATWTPEGNLGSAAQIFDRFVADANAESINLQQDLVLLEEARVGGWDE